MVTTIVATARDYFQNGLEHAISHHYNPSSLRPHKVNGELEAHVLQLACGETPDGYSRWTLELAEHCRNRIKCNDKAVS